MSHDGHVVIDADCHIREYWDLDRTYKGYVDPEYRAKYEAFSAAIKARQRQPGDVGLGALLWPRLPSHPMGVYDHFSAPRGDEGANPNRAVSGNRALTARGAEIDNACNWDPAVRLRDMDTAQVDISVMFSSQSDGYCMLHDVGFESALQRAYHRFMRDYCAESSAWASKPEDSAESRPPESVQRNAGRLRWIGNSNLRDIPESIAQLKHWAERDENFAGMFIPRACPDGTMLDNPILHPLFEVSQDLDMPIWVHGGANRPPLTPWPTAPNALYHGWGAQYAMAGLIGGGVFDLFPKLRIGFFEAGGGWMPWFIEKLDDGYRPGSATTPQLKRKPSEIVAGGQLYCSVEPDEDHLEHAVECLGEDIWLFSTDYPHPGSSWPDGVPMITERTGLSESARVKLLGENARRFLPRLAR